VTRLRADLSGSQTRSDAARRRQGSSAVLALQRRAGNTAVAQLMRRARSKHADEKNELPITVELHGVVDWVPATSMRWGDGRTRIGDERDVRRDVTELVITRDTDEDSLALSRAAARGTKIDKVTITLRHANGDRMEPYLTITLTDVFISSFQTGGQDKAVETFTLSFDKVEMESHSSADVD
jgi:type VI protein secretion system component Hcp